jgi:hypothetical protein
MLLAGGMQVCGMLLAGGMQVCGMLLAGGMQVWALNLTLKCTRVVRFDPPNISIKLHNKL